MNNEVKKGISARSLNMAMIIIASLLSVYLLYSNYQTTKTYQMTEEITTQYIDCQNDAKNMQVASDYLTNKVREFAFTGNVSCVNDFFEEIEVTRRRDNAIEDLNRYFSGTKANESLQSALEASNRLVEQEYHSMRLSIEGRGYDIKKFPEVLQNITLTPEEQSSTSEEKILLAQDLVFNESYLNQKEDIYNSINESVNELIASTRNEQMEITRKMHIALQRQNIIIVCLLIIALLLVVFTNKLILSPLHQAVANIRNQKKIPEKGSEEMRFLALTYNEMYDEREKQDSELTYEATHDSLTGLNNRKVFESMKETIEEEQAALILVDVDKFKTINDTYGHAMGDKVLIEVAHHLRTAFRSIDYVCRIGGDEFAIIMMHANPGMKAIISEKMERLNASLNHPRRSNDIPPVSLSIGIAFTENNLKFDQLYKNADSALYIVKEKGRCGYGFYE